MAVSELNAVVSEITIAAPPETVFDYLVDPDKMARWMGTRVQLEPRPTGVYAVDINAQARARGSFVEVVPPSRVVFSFGWRMTRPTRRGRARSRSPSRQRATVRTCASSIAGCKAPIYASGIATGGITTWPASPRPRKAAIQVLTRRLRRVRE